MSALVERLRALSSVRQQCEVNWSPEGTTWDWLATAADEIERLRETYQELDSDHSEMVRKVLAFSAENDRLRTGLREIAAPHPSNVPHHLRDNCNHGEIARRLLGEKTDG